MSDDSDQAADGQFASKCVTIALGAVFSLLLCLIYSLYYAVSLAEAQSPEIERDLPIHPTWSERSKVVKGIIIMLQRLQGSRQEISPVLESSPSSSSLLASPYSAGSSKGSPSVFSWISFVHRVTHLPGESISLMEGKHSSSERSVKQNKIYRAVRKMVKERESKENMNAFTMKFSDIHIEEQFNYFYLHLHCQHMRRLIYLSMIALIATSPFTYKSSLWIRVLIFIILCTWIFFSSTAKMDNHFWLADCGTNVVYFIVGLCFSTMVAFDNFFEDHNEEVGSDSVLNLQVGGWLIHTTIYALVRRAVARSFFEEEEEPFFLGGGSSTLPSLSLSHTRARA